MSDIVMKPYKIFKFFVYSACLGSGTFFFYWTFVTLLLNVSNIVGIIKKCSDICLHIFAKDCILCQTCVVYLSLIRSHTSVTSPLNQICHCYVFKSTAGVRQMFGVGT